MNTDIRIAVSFKGHRKRKRLELLLGPKAVLALIDLWISTAMNHPKGKLTGMDELDVSLEAAWEGDEKEFVKALIDVGFLDRGEDGTFELHDWPEHQPYVVHAKERSERAKKAARARWEKRSECSVSANSMQDASIKHTDCNAPTPAPTPAPIPNPSPSPDPSPMEREKADKSAKSTPPYEEIKNLWNNTAAEHKLPKVETLSTERKQRIDCLWIQYPDIEIWRRALNKVGDSTILRNKQEYIQKQYPDWKATFDWILKGDNLIKVLEGNYDR